MLIANAKIAPQGSVFFCLWETVTIFRDFQHTNLGSAEFLKGRGNSKSTQLKTSFCQQVGHWADILGGTTTGVNPRSSTVRRRMAER